MDVYWEQFKTPFLCFAGFSGVPCVFDFEFSVDLEHPDMAKMASKMQQDCVAENRRAESLRRARKRERIGNMTALRKHEGNRAKWKM